MKQRLLRFLPRHRHARLIQRLDRIAVRFHEAFENLDYDFHSNGEGRVLALLAGRAPRVVLDVGANRGDWSRMAEGLLPQAVIHAFEIVPDTFRTLSQNVAGKPRIVPHPLGLADTEGDIEVFFAEGRSEIATCVTGVSESIHGYSPPRVPARVTTGDLFCEREGIERIDFLKLDVEGFEPNVLRGFARMLQGGHICAMQFEYGYGNVVSRFLLRDYYELLAPLGMRIGKIYPRSVEFRDYDLRREDFLGPNFLAVHASQDELIRALAG
ncbi:MAG TPA: FkbM family methyltransferase [Usitatibacter sp.]|nr:FkbM family methyltransferase [Usitatibacter sp.]